MMPSKPFVFRFDDVEVREREFTLIKAGEVLTVEPKAFRTLLFLLHSPQKLISKEELLNTVWGDAAVTEGSLTRCIWLLRSLLGDDTRNPRYIETVATVGYRFVCPVEVSEDMHGGPAPAASSDVGDGSEPADLSTQAAGGPIQAKPRDGAVWRLRRWRLLAAAVLAVCLVSAIWYLRRPLPPPRISSYIQITHDGHEKILAGVDGSRIYFNQMPGGESSGFIAQVAISGSDIAQVPVALPDPFLLDVSPDGGSFLIHTPFSDQGLDPLSTLWNVRILGGSVRRIAVADSAAFSPDGNSVVYIARDGDKLGGIFIARSNGTGAYRLASVGDWIRDIAWSPDGGMIRFTMKDRIWEIASNGSNLHQVIPDWRPSSERCCGRWTPDGRLYVFLSEAQIWALDERSGLFRRPPAEPIQLTQGPIRWGEPFPASPDPRVFRGGPIKARTDARYLHWASRHEASFTGSIPRPSSSSHFWGAFPPWASCSPMTASR